MRALSGIKNHKAIAFLISGFLLSLAWPAYSYLIKGEDVRLDISKFSKNLSSGDNTVQKFAETVDQMSLSGSVNSDDKLEFIINGNGAAISSGSSGHKTAPWAGTITGWEITSTTSGSITVDIKKSTYAGYPTFASISGSEKPKITTGTSGQDLSLTTWSPAIAKGDRIQALIDSSDITGIVVLTLYVTKS